MFSSWFLPVFSEMFMIAWMTFFPLFVNLITF